MASIADFLIIGIFSGLNAACWGLYKDSLFENVHVNKFIRSILFSLVITFIFYYFLKGLGITGYNLGVFFGAVVVLERLVTEIYKGFFREESQAKYKIPVYFHIGKHIVTNLLIKGGIGTLLFIFIVGLFYLIHFYTKTILPEQGSLFAGLLLGLLMGTLEAIGGASKDAPFEGFDPLKIYRSPLVHMIWGGILTYFTGNYALLFLASGGLGRMTIELYKTFIIKGTPGKFKAEKPEFPEWREKRQIVVLPYVMTWLVAIFYLLGL